MLLRAISKFSTEEQTNYVTRLEQDFEVGDSLGEGGFGQIIKARRKCDDNEFAIKIIKFKSNLKDIETTRREANVLSELNHNNIVRYYNSWTVTANMPLDEYKKLCSDSEESLSTEVYSLSTKGYISEDNGVEEEENSESDEDSFVVFQPEPEYKKVKYLFIQMELCENNTLRHAIDNDLYKDEIKLSKYFREICEGLSYIHKRNIVHRDLKPENIFLTSEDVIKIGDFGLSKKILPDNNLESVQGNELPCGSLTDVCGTPIYIAPELRYRTSCSIKSDIYSLGVIYFEMCSKSMTKMEKSLVFPITRKYLQGLNFLTSNSKKKFLIRILLHLNDTERPTCDEILKILNSEKSIEEMKEMIQQNRKRPYQHYKNFEKTLKSVCAKKDEIVLFISQAIQIFELHGGQNITLPQFIPPLYNASDNLINLLNTRGNSVSLASTSTIAFSHYVASNNIKKMRRFSVGKVFEEGVFSPNEKQECVFQVISPVKNDHVVEAEMLYIANEIFGKNLQRSGSLYYIINHRLIFSTILKHCKMTNRKAADFINHMKNAMYTGGGLMINADFELEPEVRKFCEKLSGFFSIKEAEDCLLMTDNNGKEAFEKIYTNVLSTAFKLLRIVIENARKFGITSNIVVCPLLINERHSTGMMFKIMYISRIIGSHPPNVRTEEPSIVAMGGGFGSLIQRCNKMKKKKKNFVCALSAVEISFNIETILKFLKYNCTTRVIDVLIVAQEKSNAVSLFKLLLSKGIKSEIVNELVFYDTSNERPLFVVELFGENDGVILVYSVAEDTSIPWSLTEVFRGNLTTRKLLKICDSSGN
ncbi:eIF-2-alpha kinase GCN2 isoform X1 [Tribolium castaneum]|uniref:Eukaryotic translation initiation factor 2-alpha kinase 4-like Protein n=1 Tax=Tribolium castaneum TaxID=7070 RepID=D6WLL8_TRICA|nr:PREDICTED: eIF-2-alpha kinase GCN2 isoform X2 [Tribolium castaneum]EFA04131.2 Eukaryotic translation initiation factor 2-alpha kinase 4-like Protein [Tribolium castaneum]|eukprot:XP_008193563.1 PREDICTED: eIF-2-alpha kinase GCN2 isoform X2 [Tribolium castaneum]